jgi:hypothetical protein
VGNEFRNDWNEDEEKTCSVKIRKRHNYNLNWDGDFDVLNCILHGETSQRFMYYFEGDEHYESLTK